MDTIEIPENIHDTSSNFWDKRDEIGFLNALWKTIRGVLLKPSTFFEHLKISDSYLSPFSFYFTILLMLLALSMILSLFYKSPIPLHGLQIIILWLLWLLFMSLSIFVFGGIIHLFVRLLGGQRDFKATFHVLAYTSIYNLISIIPFIGSIVGAIWGTVIGVIGFKKIHKLSTIKSVLAYLSPWLILLSIAIAIAIINPDLLRSYPYRVRG